MSFCLVCNRLRFYWGVIGVLLLIVVFTKFYPLLVAVFLINLLGMTFTEQFAQITKIYRTLEQRDVEAGLLPVDKNELRFIYFLATLFTGLAMVFKYFNQESLAVAVILLCVILFMLAAAGFCVGRIIYTLLKKALGKT